MSKHRRAAKVDKSQPGVVNQLRKMPGVTVEVNHDDYLVGYMGRTSWIEWKDLDAISTKTGLPRPSEITPSQKRIKATWTGHYAICWTFEMVLDEIGFMRLKTVNQLSGNTG